MSDDRQDASSAALYGHRSAGNKDTGYPFGMFGGAITI
jgi:hypothetical protein